MILMSTTVTIYFLGGWLSPMEFIPFTFVPGFFWFGLKTTAILFLFIWVRAAFPRYRYDQLMRLGWKVFLPFSLGWLLFISGILLGFDWLI
jgi:NADH-quinone oxidoreductase subunit H